MKQVRITSAYFPFDAIALAIDRVFDHVARLLPLLPWAIQFWEADLNMDLLGSRSPVKEELIEALGVAFGSMDLALLDVYEPTGRHGEVSSRSDFVLVSRAVAWMWLSMVQRAPTVSDHAAVLLSTICNTSTPIICTPHAFKLLPPQWLVDFMCRFGRVEILFDLQPLPSGISFLVRDDQVMEEE